MSNGTPTEISSTGDGGEDQFAVDPDYISTPIKSRYYRNFRRTDAQFKFDGYGKRQSRQRHLDRRLPVATLLTLRAARAMTFLSTQKAVSKLQITLRVPTKFPATLRRSKVPC